MKFKYKARNKTGEMQIGYVEAPSKERAIAILQTHELFVLSIEEPQKMGIVEKLNRFFNRVKAKDLMIFTRQLATLIESELPLSNALRSLYKQTRNEQLQTVVYQLAQDVESGLAFSQALERQKPVFSDFFVSMIRSAEVTGRLEESLAFLAGYLEKESQWRSRIMSSMIYPLILIGLFIIVGGIMVVVVFPKIEAVFVESQVELPLVSDIIFSAGGFIAQWWWIILGIIGVVGFVVTDYFKSGEGKAVLGQIILQLPVFGNLFRKLYITRFAQSFSVLIKGGIPLTQAIEVAGNTINNAVYLELFQRIAQGVREGGLFSDLLLREEKYFPPMVGQMTAVGETTGRVDDMMLRVADFYEREVNDMMNNLSELLQPILIIGMGILVALLFAAILSPIYNLAQTFTF